MASVEEKPYTIECNADDNDKDDEFDPMTSDNWFGTEQSQHPHQEMSKNRDNIHAL